ncbi:MAG: oligosaccharide flippase family protein [Nitrospirae bacterium]|nr:oligosaccharide flippase family protein [Nitrospirota bacterium]
MTANDNRDLLKKGSVSIFYTVLFKVASQAFAFLSTIILIKLLSKNDYGIYNLLYSLIGVMAIIASLGLNNILNRYIPEYFRNKEFTLAHRLYVRSSIIRLLISAVILLIILLFWESLSPYLKLSEYKTYFILFAGVIITYQQWLFAKIVLDSYFLHKYTQGAYAGFVFLKSIAYLLSYYYGASLLWIIAVDLIALIVLLAANLYVYHRFIPREGGISNFSANEKKRIVRYGLYNNFNDIGIQFIDTGVDNFIIALFLDPVAVGIYAFCDRISKMIGRFNVTGYLSEVIRPLFFSLGVTAEKEKVKTMMHFLMKYTYIFYVPVFFFFVMAGEDFITQVFGKYGEHSRLFLVVLGFAAINAVSFPLALSSQLDEKVDIILFSKIFGLYNLAADILFIKLWGIMGVVIATGTAGLFRNLFIGWFVRDSIPLRRVGMLLLNTIAYWTICSLLIMTFLHIEGPLMNVVIMGVLFIMLFVVHFRFILPHDSEERRFFMALAGENKLLGFFRFIYS